MLESILTEVDQDVSRMMRKISFIAHSLRLESFDAATLAREADAPPASVNTFLARCPSDWFSKTIRATSARGGQPYFYTVTETGRVAMRALLSNLPDFEWSRVPEAAEPEPHGLSIADASIHKLAEAKPEDSAWLVRHARRNLNWAAAELRNVDPSAAREKSSKKLLALREALDIYIRQSGRPRLEDSSIKRARINRLPNVAIAALGSRGKAFAMADYAKGAVDSYYHFVGGGGVVHGHIPNVELIKEDTVSGLSSDKKARLWKRNTKLYVCIDSDQGVQQLTSALEHIRKADRDGVVVILDHGDSHEVELVAKANQFRYQARAHRNMLKYIVPASSAPLRSPTKIIE